MVTEDGGRPAISSLRRSDPFKKFGCRYNDPTCIVEGDKDCAKTGVIYEITCVKCSHEEESISEKPVKRCPGARNSVNYVGMTRTSCHWRMQSHLNGQKAKSRSNPLYRHDIDKHNGETQVYKCRILNTEKNLLPLCILEDLYIEKQDPTQRLNERNESGRGGLVRMIASRVT